MSSERTNTHELLECVYLVIWAEPERGGRPANSEDSAIEWVEWLEANGELGTVL